MEINLSVPNPEEHLILEQIKIESMIKTLLSRIAKIEAAQTGKDYEDVLQSIGEENLENVGKLKNEFEERYSSGV